MFILISFYFVGTFLLPSLKCSHGVPMKKNHSFTERGLQALKPKEKDYIISEGHGFTIRVLPSGVKTFWYYYSYGGKRRKFNLGNYPSVSLADARTKFREAANMVANGVDPQAPPVIAPREPEEHTIESLTKLYIEHCKTHLVERSVKQQGRTLGKDVLPVWGHKMVGEIRKRDAIALIESIAKRAPGQSRNVLLATRAMFSYAVHREMLEYNPFSGVGVAVKQASPNSRERTLSNDEIKKVWHTLSNWGGSEIIRRALLLILVTGQRPGEVAGMDSCETIVGEGKERCLICRRCGWWTIPAERSKNGRENRVYLTDLAFSLMPAFNGYYFPASRGADGPVIVNSLSHHITHNNNPPFLGLPRWTPHDLRRTAATGLASIGCPDEIIDEIQNHKKRGVIRTYNRYRYDNERREWLTKWSEHLKNLVGIK